MCNIKKKQIYKCIKKEFLVIIFVGAIHFQFSNFSPRMQKITKITQEKFSFDKFPLLR